ncbi:MAG: chorismate mutase [Gemmatimonadetes bacterium]|nr:chorismate mutase [Gemmatimonadota bacterium]MCY3611739.1 chorismate mutase [Gemmatimonadota bacterium]
MSSDDARTGHGGPHGGGPPAAESDEMARLRDAILQCDRQLIEVLARRRDLVTRIGNLKKRTGLPVTDPQREAAVVRRAAALARKSGVDEELVRDLIWKVIASARTRQFTSGEATE